MNGENVSASRGFTLVELLIVIAILGILANIVIPVVMGQIRRAQAASIIEDFLIFRTALFEYYRDYSEFPRDYYPGREPKDLRDYLDGRIRWSQPQWQLNIKYDWDNWKRKDGRPKHKRTGVLYGFSVTTENEELIEAIKKTYSGPFWYTLGNNYTFVIEPISP